MKYGVANACIGNIPFLTAVLEGLYVFRNNICAKVDGLEIGCPFAKDEENVIYMKFST